MRGAETQQSKPLPLLPTGGKAEANKTGGKRNIFQFLSHMLELRLLLLPVALRLTPSAPLNPSLQTRWIIYTLSSQGLSWQVAGGGTLQPLQFQEPVPTQLAPVCAVSKPTNPSVDHTFGVGGTLEISHKRKKSNLRAASSTMNLYKWSGLWCTLVLPPPPDRSVSSALQLLCLLLILCQAYTGSYILNVHYMGHLPVM